MGDSSSITVDGCRITGTAHDILTAHTTIANAIEKLGLELSNEFLWFPYTGSHMDLESGVARSVQLVRLRAESSVSVVIVDDSTSAGWFDGFYGTVGKAHTGFVQTYGSGGRDERSA
ncbi:hypothetical protein ABTZ44_07475 [Microbacterium oxydans]|uniref:hypothetical protein n=1 Tax=Microbacterium oxydans TaxID=82380 RepID=UPI00331D0BEE|nr:hypothetical protein [Microbacterium oxydans]